MKFIHLADVHLDIPFKTLSDRADMGSLRRLEQRKAFKKAIDFAKEKNVDAIFIAGDLFDYDHVKKETVEFVNNLFNEIPEIRVFITPGNHDPFLKNSFYNTFKFADNVTIFDSNLQKVETEKYNVYGYGFDNFEMEGKIKEGEIFNLDKSKINIFVSHGDIYTESKYNVMPLKTLENAGFDYIALGHVHKRDKYYAGSLISLGFDELGKHGFVYGEIEENQKDREATESRIGSYLENENKLNIENKLKNDQNDYFENTVEIYNKKEENENKIDEYFQNNAKLKFVQADERELIVKDLDVSRINSEDELIEKINEIDTGKNLYEVNLVGTRNFEISINIKLIQQNVIKIKNSTKIEITNMNENEKTLSGFFAKNLKEKLENNEITEEEYEEALELGKRAFEK